MNRFLLLFFIVMFLPLSACDTKYASYSDQKVRKEHMECNSNQNMSPARGVACGNYEKECLRRKKAGNNICVM
ncbi:MAG: hypothetical protein HQL46_07200 [Gammaproteobacteria bacterium]|nr:hypothetical protein [Gammaproteobacteria bacterium]